MSDWLKDIVKFVIQTPAHPIYQRERAGWSYVKVWRQMQRGCVPLIILLLVGTTCFCSGITALILLPDPSLEEAWLLIPAAGLVGLFFGESLLNFIIGLIATMLGSTVISAEIEAQTFGLLRLTPMSPREIVLAKFGAVMRQVRAPMLIDMAVRMLLILMVGIAILIFVVSGALGTLLNDLALQGTNLVTFGIMMGLLAVGSLLIAICYLVRPVFDMLLYASLGVFASAMAKTRAGGLVTAGGFRLVLAMVSYMMGQVFSVGFSLFTFPLMSLPSSTSPEVFAGLSGLTTILSLLLIMAFDLSVAAALLMLTSRRAQHLPPLG